jgi:hypothetical protein
LSLFCFAFLRKESIFLLFFLVSRNSQ